MYGSIMRGRVKPGRREEFERVLTDLAPKHFERGLHSAELAWEDGDPNRVVVIIHFRDRESYKRNAENADTDSDFRRQRELLEDDPEWIDVEYGQVAEARTATSTTA